MRYVQLRAFHYVAICGGFSRAAEAMFLTQPAVSDQVRKLEEEYDVLLFNRHKKQVTLTETGQRLLEITRRMFDIEQQALSSLIDEQPLEPLFDMLRAQCRERKRRMTEQLARQGIEDLVWTEPRGGLHLWVTLPSGLDGEALLRGAWLKGVIFQPGAPFYVSHPRGNTARITHAFADERQIKLGVARLAESIGEFTGRWSRS